MLFAGGSQLYLNAQLAAGRLEGKLDAALFVVAEGKAFVVRYRYPRNDCLALRARDDVVPPDADGRGGPEAEIAYKKFPLQPLRTFIVELQQRRHS